MLFVAIPMIGCSRISLEGQRASTATRRFPDQNTAPKQLSESGYRGACTARGCTLQDDLQWYKMTSYDVGGEVW